MTFPSNIPGFPGGAQAAPTPAFPPPPAPAVGGFPNPSAPVPGQYAVPQPVFAPPPAVPFPGAPGFAPPPPAAYQAPVVQFAPAPAAPQQVWGQPQQPQQPQGQQPPPPLPDLSQRLAEATMGVQQTPRLTDSLGRYQLRVLESGRRVGNSKKDGHKFDILWIDFEILATTAVGFQVGAKASTAFDLLADGWAATYMDRRLKAFSAGIMQIDIADPRVPQVYPMIATNQLVGRTIACDVYLGKPNKNTGKQYNEEGFSAT